MFAGSVCLLIVEMKKNGAKKREGLLGCLLFGVGLLWLLVASGERTTEGRKLMAIVEFKRKRIN